MSEPRQPSSMSKQPDSSALPISNSNRAAPDFCHHQLSISLLIAAPIFISLTVHPCQAQGGWSRLQGADGTWLPSGSPCAFLQPVFVRERRESTILRFLAQNMLNQQVRTPVFEMIIKEQQHDALTRRSNDFTQRSKDSRERACPDKW